MTRTIRDVNAKAFKRTREEDENETSARLTWLNARRERRYSAGVLARSPVKLSLLLLLRFEQWEGLTVFTHVDFTRLNERTKTL